MLLTGGTVVDVCCCFMYSTVCTCGDSCTYMYSTACIHMLHVRIHVHVQYYMHPHTTWGFIHTGLRLEFLSVYLKVSLEICMKLCHLFYLYQKCQ